MSGAPVGCPPFEALAAAAGRREESPQRAALAPHLAACAECRDRFAQLCADEQLLIETADALAPDAPSCAEPPPIVDGYRLLGESRRGGQGIVFAALQLATGRKVALKVLLDGALASPRQQLRFEREVNAVVGLRHPHIVTVFDGGTTRDGRRFFAMEWVDGVTLDRFAAQRRAAGFASREAVAFFQKLVDAIHHAHQRGVLHRDLKPGNVLVDAAGEPRVVDFGLAKVIEPDAEKEGRAAAATMTRPGWFVGTLAYAAPEQLRGAGDAVDARADLFALGVLLHELLLGAPPFQGDGSLAGTIRAVLEQEPEFPRRFDDELAAIVRKALAKEPAARYQTALDLARDLERWRVGEAVEAKRGRFGYAARAFVRRHRWRVAAAALVLLALLGAGLFSALSWQRAVRDAAKRERIDGFVQRMFSALDPEHARGRVVPVSELLAAAAAEIERAPIDDPEVEAELRETIGRACASVGAADDAVRHFERALALRGGLPPSGEPLPDVVDDLAVACYGSGDIARATTLATAWLAHVERRTPHDAATLATARKNLAQTHVVRGDFAKAQPLLEDALATWRAIAVSDEALRSLVELARIALLRGRFEEAQARIEEARAVSVASGSPTLQKVGELAVVAGELAEARGDLAAASADYDEACRAWTTLYGAESLLALGARVERLLAISGSRGPAAVAEERAALLARLPDLSARRDVTAARLQAGLGALALRAGDLGEARARIEASLALYEALAGGESASVAAQRSNLASVLRASGQPRAGLAAVRLAGEELRGLAAAGAGELPLAAAQLERAWCAVECGELEEAEEAARAALEVREAWWPADDARCRAARVALAFVLQRRGTLDEAEELLAECLPPPIEADDVEVARASRVAAQVARARGDFAAADVRFRAALERLERGFGAESLDLAMAQDEYGWFLIERRRLDEAGVQLAAALATRARRLAPDHPLLGWSRNNVGVWRFFRGELDAAQEEFEAAVAIGRRGAEPADPALGTWIGNLAVLLHQRGDSAAAEPLLIEARQLLVAARGEADLEARRLAGTLADLHRKRGDLARAAEFDALAAER
ncbi:MAG: tetratricopeptide repeat protein [Planctomycetes bacterium]|nr:tetratricopeptide repeat protein [Planctomycetota bacterium]